MKINVKSCLRYRTGHNDLLKRLVPRGGLELVKVYSGSTPDEIISTAPDFLEKIGIRDHLSMNRANGLAAMIKQISIYGMAFKAKQNM